jgi:beta-lysine 5,6-aminomutase beta subunit
VDVAEAVVAERDFPMLSSKVVPRSDRAPKRVSVVGACIGTDAHTVGIDAILN